MDAVISLWNDVRTKLPKIVLFQQLDLLHLGPMLAGGLCGSIDEIDCPSVLVLREMHFESLYKTFFSTLVVHILPFVGSQVVGNSTMVGQGFLYNVNAYYCKDMR